MELVICGRTGLNPICRNGRLIGVFTNGGFEEYISVPKECLHNCRICDSDALQATLSPHHALERR